MGGGVVNIIWMLIEVNPFFFLINSLCENRMFLAFLGHIKIVSNFTIAFRIDPILMNIMLSWRHMLELILILLNWVQ